MHCLLLSVSLLGRLEQMFRHLTNLTLAHPEAEPCPSTPTLLGLLPIALLIEFLCPGIEGVGIWDTGKPEDKTPGPHNDKVQGLGLWAWSPSLYLEVHG